MSFHAANVSIYWQYDTIVTKRCSSCPLYHGFIFRLVTAYDEEDTQQ